MTIKHKDILGQSVSLGEHKAIKSMLLSDEWALLVERVFKPMGNDIAIQAVMGDKENLDKYKGRYDAISDIIDLAETVVRESPPETDSQN